MDHYFQMEQPGLLAEPVCVRQPLRSGGPRIPIVGSGEKKTCASWRSTPMPGNLFGMEPEEIAHKIRVLDAHCETEGRDPAEVQRTVVVGDDPLEDTDAFQRRMEAYAALGIDQA
ncbi:MAG: hypothetical protein ABIR34_06465, partial [Marmoricola sp.]